VLSDRIHFDAKMVRFKREKSELVAEEEAISTQDDVQEEPFVVLQKLVNEEAKLMEEKKNLDSLREKLLSKIQEEIDNKKNNIQKLKSEITDLKFSCEELTKSFKTGTKVE
jgi:chromosome segregation ATPase